MFSLRIRGTKVKFFTPWYFEFLFEYFFQFAVDYLAKILLVDTLHFKYSTYRFASSQPNVGSVVYSAPESEQVISPTETDVLTDLPNGNHFEMRPTNHSPAFTFESQTDSGFETGSQVRLIRQGSSVTTSCMTHRERTGYAMEQFAACMTKKIKKENETQTQHAEWKVIASVLDRLFFFIYLALIVLSLAFLFPWPVWLAHTQLHLYAYIRTQSHNPFFMYTFFHESLPGLLFMNSVSNRTYHKPSSILKLSVRCIFGKEKEGTDPGFLRQGRQPQGGAKYYLATFSRKMHENEECLMERRTSVPAPLPLVHRWRK